MVPMILRDSYRSIKRAFHVLRGQDLWQGTQMECQKLRLGNERAEWCIYPGALSEQSVVYSFGVGDDVSFDLELIRRFRVNVHAFDPTPRAIAWTGSQGLPGGFIFHNYGVAAYDGISVFHPPENPSYVSYSVLSRRGADPCAVEAPVRRITTIMKMLGHERIALLKMDIEGAEYSVIQDLLTCGVPMEQLLVEFHHHWPEIGPEKTKEAVRDLNRAGFQIFDVSPTGEEYSFLRV
jgi:FkbM family methyltransferase